MKRSPTIEEDLLLLQQRSQKGAVSVEEILHILSGKGRELILLFLSLPFCQPLQIPGLSVPFGLVIAVIGLRIAFGTQPWLPKMILAKKVTPQTLQKIIEKTLWLVRKMKRWVHPRLVWLSQGPVLQIVNGLLISVLGIFLALPLPIPLSNLMAAWAIFLMGLGLLEDDGVFVIVGYLISLCTVAFFIAIALSINTLLR